MVACATALLLLASVVSAQKTFDTRVLFVPTYTKTAPSNAQVAGFDRSMTLQHSFARSVFEPQNATLTLLNFPLPGNESAALVLERTHPVVDANTEFYTHTKAGKVPFKVGPVFSYRGTVDGDPQTSVTLHYSEGDLTGFIMQANGQRVAIGRDFNSARTAAGTPHMIADELTMFGGNLLADFRCGSEDLPVDPDAAARKMVIPSVPKGGEGLQAEYLRNFTMAMVLREDLDSTMKRRGQTDEEIAQYFIKIIAAVAQTYEQELNAYLNIGYFEKFTEDEPSGYFYDGKTPGALLNEFSLDWSSRMNNVDRTVAHLYTRMRPGADGNVGGIAYLDGMCSKKNGGGYGVSTMQLDASTVPGDPNRRNGFVWDVFVSSHEMGHNIGAYHTHNCYWSPPVDTCQIKGDRTDACYDLANLRRVVPGTIMSYCHLVNGESTPLTFGTRPAERMRGWIATAACNPLVSAPIVKITEPRGPDAYNVGERLSIRWASARVSTVNIRYGPTPSGPWTSIVSNVNAADRQYFWTTTALPFTSFWLRLEDAANPSVSDTSLVTYSIRSPVKLDAPLGGERLGIGSKYMVRWTKSADVPRVNLEFSADGAAYTTLVASTAATQFEWTVPNEITENARMRVTALNFPTVPSTSGAFAIGNRRFALEIPNEGTFLCKNQLNQYRWSSDFIPTIRIQYSTDGGAIWRTATQQSTIDAVIWQVFSRNVNMNNVPAGMMVKLRVIDAGSEEVLDTRNELRIDSCNAAVSVDESSQDLPFSIMSVSPNPASSSVRLTLSTSIAVSGDVVLISSDGQQLVLRSAATLVPGLNAFDVQISGVASGTYRIGLRDGSSLVVAPLVIVR